MWQMASQAWSEAEVTPVEPVLPEVIEIPRPKRRRPAAAPVEDANTGELWDPDPETQPFVHRAAVNGLNAAMLVFALPVGAALLTLAVLGRESLGFSARATALTGSTMAFSQSEIGQSVIAFFG
jgi:hypothetical protein